MNRKGFWRFVAVAGVLAVGACDVLDFGGDDDDDRNGVEAAGVVMFVDVEGGCWTLRTEDLVYEPLNLPEGMKVDGLQVEFEGEVRSDVDSICQIGPIIDIEEIERSNGS